MDALLQHFVNEGVVGVPTPLGYDDQGRQVVSFVEGHVSDDPRDLDESRLMELGQLIRRLHDVAVTFTPPTDAK